MNTETLTDLTRRIKAYQAHITSPCRPGFIELCDQMFAELRQHTQPMDDEQGVEMARLVREYRKSHRCSLKEAVDKVRDGWTPYAQPMGDDVVERVAKAMCLVEGDPIEARDGIDDGYPWKGWFEYETLAKAAIAAMPPMGGEGWRAIDSAPKDGAWIFAYCPDVSISNYPCVVFWDDEWLSARSLETMRPTHWMPLPAAPEGK